MLRKTSCLIAMMLAVALVSGCKKAEDHAADQVGNEAQSAAPASPQAGAISVQGGALALPFEISTRYDRQAVTKNSKRKQRQILLEALEVPAEQVLSGVAEALETAGYKGGKVVDYRGGERQYFRKKGADRITVIVRAKGAGGPKLKNASATASIYMTETAPAPKEGTETLESTK